MTDDTSGTDLATTTPASAASPAAPTDLKEYLLLLPRLLKLVWRLARDPRVPARTKATLFLLGGYLWSPIEMIPDFIPGIGQLDDIAVLAFVLDQMLNRLPEEIVREHWDGDEDILQVVKEILDIATAFVPGWLRNRFGS
ncbi:MAG: YkvA family protein [Actinomycetota bacterium]|nr:YkvA family protein [Actinomycetota bacterium]